MARRDLPSGTVTFLFTDVEGSTRLLHEHGEAYAELLSEHRRLLRDAFRRHGGVEVDTQGDAFFYAFARASDALAAAEAGRRALEATPVRVRIGVHTGEPQVTEEGYVGLDVHKAARIAAAGHGGQVLVSEAAVRLVSADDDLVFRDLGRRRLKDIEQPVGLFQLGSERFPPARTLDSSNLPLPVNPLVGRKEELADVLRLYRRGEARLVTVTGPGGVGKTRFALEAAHELVEHAAHGVWFVDLSALQDPALVLPTVASALGARGELADYVGDRELVVVLDNFEQVVDAATDVSLLLQRCPNARVLVTSREALRVRGERLVPLSPLPEAPAVTLLLDRARALDPQFDARRDTLTRLVDRLDRLPLAIELAAARVRALGAETLLARLDQRLPLLTSRARDLPERQRTLRATIEWSHELLDAGERRLTERLSVFAGGFTVEAAEVVCDADLDTLELLVDRSLVRRDGERFGFLETIREFAAERLEGSGEAAELRRRHAEYVLALAEEAGRKLRGPEEAAWLEVLDAEVHNLRAAIAWLRAAEPRAALRLASAVGDFWQKHGHQYATETLAVMESLLQSTTGDDLDRANAFLAASGLATTVRDNDSAVRLSGEAIAVAGRLGEDLLRARSVNNLGIALLRREELDAAEAAFEESAAVRERLGDAGASRPLNNIAAIALRRGDEERAERLLLRARELAATAGDRAEYGLVLAGLAEVALRRGRHDEGRRLFVEALRNAIGVSPGLVADALDGIAWVEADRSRWRTACTLLGAVTADREARGYASARQAGRKAHELVSAAADPADVEAALAAGRSLTLDEAVELVLSEDDA